MSVTTHAAPARGMNALGALSEHIVKVLEKNGADISQLGVPPQPEPTDALWEDVSVPQARARRNMWRNSIVDAAHDEYLAFRFPHLDENQKPKTLVSWLDSLIEAKKLDARPSHLNMIIPGPIGSGKTAAACTLGNEAAERGLWTLFVKHATYLTWRRPDSAPHNMKAWEVRRKFVECDLLILDELCGEMDMTATEFARRETIDLIDARISAGRPTAYTTNLRSRRKPGSQAMGVVDILGERLLSRLESSAHLAAIVGPDRRKPAKPLDW
ncbi:ATP-binding protein [Streptomyces sp. AN-3]|uniref:ATP-binding protein n=1 Tax=Streptomyces sp. AN-3 TaxID=3044177 RepID=UPI00249A193A|nr:ATP-binding protein [Streptomyces sp. AN-3]MDI3102015.1 ATP-binding protein [Streptomyces sp. AN-3]MDV6291244.1 ATP-binding protein [Streptomyces sp. UP1A-1]